MSFRRQFPFQWSGCSHRHALPAWKKGQSDSLKQSACRFLQHPDCKADDDAIMKTGIEIDELRPIMKEWIVTLDKLDDELTHD